MCYSAEISLNTFIFGSIFAIMALLINKTRILSIFIVFSISLIQLLEYVAWININNNDNEIRKRNIYYLSILGCFILFIQILLINYNNLEGIERIIIILILFITFIFIMIYNYKNNQFDITIGKNGHLVWHWIDIKYLNVIVLFFWLYAYIRINDYYITSFLLLSMLFSVYNYYEYKTFGSMWCYIGNLIWFILITDAIYKYIKL